MKRILTFLMTLMLVFGLALSARAQIMGDVPTFFDVFFNITFLPPTPCLPENPCTLSGDFRLFYGREPFNGSGDIYFPPAEPRPDPIYVKAGESFFDVFRFDMNTVPADSGIYLNFDGGVFQPNDEPVINAYAFDVGTKSVDSDPGVAPLIFLGNAGPDFLAEPRPDPFTLPIFAFASPGVQVGTLTITDIAAVPEPGTLLLLGSGLAGLAMFRKRLRI